eukprot:GHVS01029101.1.p1 GENE.GHVS01029101.1~~GHVS01029101.1.p1  ORF type:complete len:915 (+),score=97.57 GHVS01029101.1:325-3069(+)
MLFPSFLATTSLPATMADVHPVDSSRTRLNTLQADDGTDASLCSLTFDRNSMSLLCCGSPPAPFPPRKLVAVENWSAQTPVSATSTATPSPGLGIFEQNVSDTEYCSMQETEKELLVHPHEAEVYDGVSAGGRVVEEEVPRDSPPPTDDSPPTDKNRLSAPLAVVTEGQRGEPVETAKNYETQQAGHVESSGEAERQGESFQTGEPDAVECSIGMIADNDLSPEIRRFNTVVLDEHFGPGGLDICLAGGLSDGEVEYVRPDDSARKHVCERCGVSFSCPSGSEQDELEDQSPTSQHHCWNFLTSLSRTMTECYQLLSVDDISGCQGLVLGYISQCEKFCRAEQRTTRSECLSGSPLSTNTGPETVSSPTSSCGISTCNDKEVADIDMEVLYARSLLSLYMDDVFQNIVVHLKGMKDVYRVLANESRWQEIKSKNPDVTCYMREEPPSDAYGKTSYTVRYRGIINLDILNLLNVTSDLETMVEWDHMLESVQTLFRISAFHFITHTVHNFRVPLLAKREWLVEYGLDANRSSGVLTYVMSSIGPSHPFYKYVCGNSEEGENKETNSSARQLGLFDAIPFNANPKHVAAEMILAGGAFEAIRPGLLYFDTFVNADVKLPLPGWLLKYITQEVGGRAIDAGLDIAKNKSKPEDRMGILLTRKREYFKAVKRLVSDHIEDVRVDPRYVRFRHCQQSLTRTKSTQNTDVFKKQATTGMLPMGKQFDGDSEVTKPMERRGSWLKAKPSWAATDEYTIVDWSHDLASRNDFSLLHKLASCYYYGRVEKLKMLAGRRFAVSVPKRIISHVERDDSDVIDGSTGLPDPSAMSKDEIDPTADDDAAKKRRIRVEISYQFIKGETAFGDPPVIAKQSGLARVASMVDLRRSKTPVVRRSSLRRGQSRGGRAEPNIAEVLPLEPIE